MDAQISIRRWRQDCSWPAVARRCAARIAVSLLLVMPSVTRAALVDAIEYYHAGLDHYFVTALADEITKLDSGFFPGWQRTGQSFKVGEPGSALAGGAPVCRFYGDPELGLDSHFYSASPAECLAVQQKFMDAWLLESSNVFQVYLPDATGACPAGSVPTYRVWNNRRDSNHRYTTSLAILQSMVAKGYVAEGYGSPAAPVAMCSPVSTVGAVPKCTLSANDTSPVVGSTITLVANCSEGATSFAWLGCASSSATCTVTGSIAGNSVYSVQAGNASGMSAPADITIFWRAMLPPQAAPTCSFTYTAKTDPPTVGSPLLLDAACTGAPFAYFWTGCASSGATCLVTETTAGPHVYTVLGRNEGGDGAPASLTLNWNAMAPSSPGFCGDYPALLRSYLGWSDGRLLSIQYSDPPGFAWNGVWVVTLTVPSSVAPASAAGRVSVAEYVGIRISREVTISRVPCDFRPLDATGINGPVFHAYGTGVSALFTAGPGSTGVAGLVPGQTYYVNIRNALPTGDISCPETQDRCDAVVDVALPR